MKGRGGGGRGVEGEGEGEKEVGNGERPKQSCGRSLEIWPGTGVGFERDVRRGCVSGREWVGGGRGVFHGCQL